MAKVTIVCVDDEKIILNSLRDQLKANFSGKFDFEFADSGAEALDLIEELQADNVPVGAVVSDWLMPGMKGDELLVRIHQQYPKIVTIMLTGQADEDAIQRAKNDAKLYSLIRKPWREQDLVNTLKSGLGV